MENALVELLEKVQLGLISEDDAEKQYQTIYAKKHADETDLYDIRFIEKIKSSTCISSRLFVFLPFGFGNQSASFSWRHAFEHEKELEVWLIGASNISAWPALIDLLVEKIAPMCDEPFAVYGHSMGGIVAYEVLIELQKRYELSPTLFLPSSVVAPFIFERLKYTSPIYELNDRMEDSEIRQILQASQVILPKSSGIKPLSDKELRNDIKLVKQYTFQHQQQKLRCPVYALQANNDILVKDPIGVSLWEQCTSEDFNFKEIEGSHLYFMNPPICVFTLIRNSLNIGLDSPTSHSNEKSQLSTKVYRLDSFSTGTEDVAVYPYGIKPKGYLVYQAEGTMAAHIWNPAREERVTTKDKATESHLIESCISYLAYSGKFQIDDGIVAHDVLSSTDPNFEGDTLLRYLNVNRKTKKIILNTAPLTFLERHQNKASGFSRLVWNECLPSTAPSHISQQHALSGTWRLKNYRNKQGYALGDSPKGTLIFTECGFFSIVISAKNRNRPKFDNLNYASNNELRSVADSVISYCGQYQVNQNSLNLTVEADAANSHLGAISMRIRFGRDKTLLFFRSDNTGTQTSIDGAYIWECCMSRSG